MMFTERQREVYLRDACKRFGLDPKEFNEGTEAMN
jgi:hypothetical protein